MIKRNKYMMIMALMASAMIMTACGKKKVNYNVDGKLQENATTEDKTSIEASTERQVTVSGVAERLGIPQSVNIEIPSGNGGLNKITINDDEIEVPARDVMYTVNYKTVSYDSTYRRKIAEALFDLDTGIYVYNGDMENMPSYEEAEALLTNGGTLPTYTENQYIGKFNDNIYILTFYIDYYDLDNQFVFKRVSDKIWEKDAPEGTEHIWLERSNDTYSQELNMTNMSEEEIENVVMEYPELLDIDAVCTGKYDLMRHYQAGYDANLAELLNVLDGVEIEYKLSVDNQLVYQPNYFVLDEYMSQGNPYFEPAEQVRINMDSYGIEEVSSNFRMEKSGSLERTDELLDWEAVIEIAKESIPSYYEEHHTSYSEICFDDVRLTYFKLWTDESGQSFKIVPVYIFAEQLNQDGKTNHNMPTQLIIINAQDGSLINPTQDDSAWHNENKGKEIEIQEKND